MAHMAKTTINIDDGLLDRAKRTAARQGVTLTRFIEDALRARMAPVAAGKKKFVLRVPVVKGKAPPAVDLGDRGALYELMERE